MPQPVQKTFLEVYGLTRLAYGVATLVGLMAAFFIKELIVQYPSQVTYLTLSQETIALTYFVVILRAIFHIVAGIGIARLEEWTKVWLFTGWPILILMSFGLMRVMYGQWAEEGYVTDMIEVISWPMVAVYLSIVAVDVFYISSNLSELNDDPRILPQSGGRMGQGKILTVFFVTTVFFAILLFVGRPIQQGFHKGFYKSRGVRSKNAPAQDVAVHKKDMTPEERDAIIKAADALVKKKAPKDNTAEVLRQSETVVMNVKPLETKKSVERNIFKTKEAPVEKGTPFIKLVGYLGACSIMLGLGIQLFVRQGLWSMTFAFSYVVLGLGFLMILIYGLSLNLLPIALCGFAALILCGILFIKVSQDVD